MKNNHRDLFAAGTSASIYIKKKVCLSVCLFVLHAFGHGATKCDQTFQESSSHPEEGQQLLFTQKDAVLRLQQGHLSI
jgi:hypothetical protein